MYKSRFLSDSFHILKYHEDRRQHSPEKWKAMWYAWGLGGRCCLVWGGQPLFLWPVTLLLHLSSEKKKKMGKIEMEVMVWGWGFKLIITGFSSYKYLTTLLCFWEAFKNRHWVQLRFKKIILEKPLLIGLHWVFALYLEAGTKRVLYHFSPSLEPFPLS